MSTQFVAHYFDRGESLRIIHSRRTQHTDTSESLTVCNDGSDHHGAGSKWLNSVLCSNRNGEATIDDIAHERHHDVLLFERVQHVAHDFHCIERMCK